MKKTTIIALALAAMLILGGGGVFAAGQIARSNAIGEENACQFAYVDAGILPEEAEHVSTHFEFEKGRFVYDIDFTARGMKYEYLIHSGSGMVLEKSVEPVSKSPNTATFAANNQTQAAPVGTSAAGETAPAAESSQSAVLPAAPVTVELEDAKALALKDAGVKAEDVSFSKIKVEREDGYGVVYEIIFHTVDKVSYEYEIAADGGMILEIKKEIFSSLPNESQPAVTRPTAAPTQPAATQPAAAQPTPAQPAPTQPAVAPTQPAPAQPAPSKPAATQPAQPASTFIRIEKAKEIALSDAGLSGNTSVVFEKAELDRENGRTVYEIEFFIRGVREYDYDIDALSGAIIEKSSEPWDD